MPSQTSDLLSPELSNLLLSDTFNEWLNRTNTVIDYLSPLNLYDVQAATASGITEGRPSSYALSTGLVTLTLNHKGGEQGISANTTGVLGLDFRGMNDIADGISNDDLIAVFDVNAGVTKKVIASKVLPLEISGNHTFQSNVTIGGNLTVNGTQTTINSDDLRTEDEQIELAFQNEIRFQITGNIGGPSTLTAGTLSVGQTAFYADTAANATAGSSEAVGFVRSYSAVFGAGGTAATANVVVHGPFATGGPSEFQNGGFISTSPTGAIAGATHAIVDTPVGASGFPTDTGYLNPPGIVIKGASGDKQILWYVDHNSFLVNTNLGTTAEGAIKSAVYDSKESSLYGTLANNFVFKSDRGSNTVFSIAEDMTGNVFTATLGTGGVGGKINELAFSFGLSGPTGTKDDAVFKFYGGSGASGQQLAGVPNSMFAENFNADQLDGAHASITAGAYKIPIAGANGIINESWLDTSNVQRTFTVAGHGLTVGEAVRIPLTGSLTSALGTTPAEAEAIGIVSGIDGNDVSVVQSGFVSGLASSSKIEGITGGEVFFLSRTITGGLTTTAPSYEEGPNLVQKPMLVGFDGDSGYVVPYIGQQVQQATDELYLQGIIPIGTIYPFTGNVIPNSDFLFCDGDLKKRSEFPDLGDLITDIYSVQNVLFTRTDADNGTISLTGGTRGISTFSADNDLGRLILERESDGVTAAVNVSAVNESTKVITFTRVSGTLPVATGDVTVKASSDDNTNFFLPDLRNRSAIGIGRNDTNSLVRTLGEQGGSDDSGSDGTLDPFLATNFIIRAKPGVNALVFTGHNHDDIYPRMQGGSTISTPSVAGATAFGLGFTRASGTTFPHVQITGGPSGPHIFHTDHGVVGAANDYLVGVGLNDSAEAVADSFIVYTDKTDNSVNPFDHGRELLHVGTDGKHYFRSDGDETGVEKYTPTTTGLEVLGNIKAITGQSIGGDKTTSLSSETTITPDFDTGNIQTFELAESKSYTLATPSNIQPGAYYTLVFVQPSSNPSAITNINSNYLFPNGVEPALTKSADAIDMINIVCVPTSSGNKLLCNFNTALS